MAVVANKRQPCFDPPSSHAQELTIRMDRKLKNIMENLCCAREHSVQFLMRSFYIVKLYI